MRPLDVIAKDGVTLPERQGGVEDVSLFSLKAALQAYFSTYQTMKYSLHALEKPLDDDLDSSHKSEYYSAYSETIYHFHHFIELALKRFLRREHPALAIDARSQPVILHRILLGEELDPLEYEQLRAPAMNEIVNTLCALLKEERIDTKRLGFVLTERPLLGQLSYLRNSLTHKGSSVLRYPALDELVGGHILPFILKITSLDEFADEERIWKYRTPTCGADPINQIVACVTNKYELREVAFLKELGRAAYLNPLMGSGKPGSKGISHGIYEFFDRERVNRARNAADAELGNGSVVDIKDCPVCGVQPLLVYDEVEMEGEEIVDGELVYEKAWRYTWQVECLCCTFQMDNHLGNASDYSLPIEDYWEGQEI